MTKPRCRITRRLLPGLAAALSLLPGLGAAATYYVTPTGAGDFGGTNWHNAFSNVQAAADLATNAGGDTIYLRWGVYSNASQIMISNAAGLTIVGGCVGNGTNDYSGTNSTLTRTGGAMRIVYACDSVITMACVTVSGGYFASDANYGAGLLFTNCHATLTNCAVRDNTNACTSSAYGGGIYAAGGSLTILDSAFYNNTLRCLAKVNGYGGGIAAVNCLLVVRGSGSVFSNNVSGFGAGTGEGYPYGGAIYSKNGALTLEGATLIGNQATAGGDISGYGGAVYHAGSGAMATLTGCWFEANSVTKLNIGGICYGGAVYVGGATSVVTDCTFTNNFTISANRHAAAGRGGAVYATGLQSLQMFSSVFHGNRVVGSGLFGGALYVTACSNTVVDRCTLDGSGLLAGTAPELVYVNAGGSAQFLNSTLLNNDAGRGLYFAGAAGSTLGMTNCALLGNAGNGLIVSNGSVQLFNCLVARNIQDGMTLAAGTVTVANCTLADNGGWGFNRSGGTGTVINSIAWGNSSGGILSNENVWVDYSCLQTPAYGGASNLPDNPLFANVAECYYLSSNGLYGQATSSPCIDAGNNSAESWGLDTRTTRTDSTNDADTVDLGYHYATGVVNSVIRTVTNCYVDAVNGNDSTGDGLGWNTAWKSLTMALSKVTANATIHAATGTYNAVVGEVFPLTVQMPGLTLAASNADATLTVVDNAGTNGQRILQAQGMGELVLRGLTFRGGCFTNGANYGAGLLFQACVTMLTNCVVRDNTNSCTSSAYGGGIYAAGGSLTILDSAFYHNTLRCLTSVSGYGGGIAAVTCPLVVRGSRSVFSNNVSGFGTGTGEGYPYGGAIYSKNGALTLEGATLIGNQATAGGDRNAYGGSVFHTGSGMQVTITGCWFEANATTKRNIGGVSYGGTIYLSGATGVISACTFTNNYASCGTYGGNQDARGGGIYANGLQSLQLVSSVFRDNRVQGSKNVYGGTLYVNGCSNMLLDRCAIDGRGISVGAEHIYVNGGTNLLMIGSTVQNNRLYKGVYFAGTVAASFAMTNCLVANNGDDGLLLANGAATVVNCTLADNAGWGIARPTSAALTVKNSILWGNGLGGIGHNQNLVLAYSDSQDFWTAAAGAGNFSADPLFLDPAAGDYHAQSTAGSWRDMSGWTRDARLSPCVDAGDPASVCALEPKPNGGRVNLGAYGNTAEASLSPGGTVIQVR